MIRTPEQVQEEGQTPQCKSHLQPKHTEFWKLRKTHFITAILPLNFATKSYIKFLDFTRQSIYSPLNIWIKSTNCCTTTDLEIIRLAWRLMFVSMQKVCSSS